MSIQSLSPALSTKKHYPLSFTNCFLWLIPMTIRCYMILYGTNNTDNQRHDHLPVCLITFTFNFFCILLLICALHPCRCPSEPSGDPEFLCFGEGVLVEARALFPLPGGGGFRGVGGCLSGLLRFVFLFFVIYK